MECRDGFGDGLAALPVAAQSMALPAADPVGISRSGAQVAYGYSLEAAATNPALLSSLKEKGGFYLAVGLEMSATQQSLESEQTAIARPTSAMTGIAPSGPSASQRACHRP